MGGLTKPRKPTISISGRNSLVERKHMASAVVPSSGKGRKAVAHMVTDLQIA
ncbi:hypothetical protein ACLOJK_010557 [Asimina triloba]